MTCPESLASLFMAHAGLYGRTPVREAAAPALAAESAVAGARKASVTPGSSPGRTDRADQANWGPVSARKCQES